MAHTAPPSGPHRRLESILGIVALIVGAAVAVVSVSALNHPKGHLASSAQTGSLTPTTPASSSKAKSSPVKSAVPKTSAAPKPPVTASTPNSATASTGKLPLVVLSNTSTVSASNAAARFRQGGWTVTDTSTFDGSILSTAVYYDPNVPGAHAAADALQTQFPAIQRVKEKFEGLPQGSIVVVLTSDYS